MRFPSFGRKAEEGIERGVPEGLRRGSTPMFVEGLRDLKRARKSSLAVRRAGGGMFVKVARRPSTRG